MPRFISFLDFEQMVLDDGTEAGDPATYWMDDQALGRCPEKELDDEETKFWNELIPKYLYPLDEDKPAVRVREHGFFFLYMTTSVKRD
jgi:hypothetical protein